MKEVLIHGCYDLLTLRTLLGLGGRRFAFDLRGRSLNLVPYNQLLELLKELGQREVVLIFEDDRQSTILSFLDLLKNHNVILEFRDAQDLGYYESFEKPFYWLFRPEADWKTILHSSQLRGLLLPYKFKELYQNLPDLWGMIEGRNLEVLLHAENSTSVTELAALEGVSVSFDLGPEVEVSFRRVDQERLKKLSIWRNVQ